MIGLLLTAALQSAPIVAPGTAPSAPTSPPPAAAAPVAPSPAADDPEAVVRNLSDMYEKSCGGRIYGMYADACNNLAGQLRKAQAEARRAERSRHK